MKLIKKLLLSAIIGISFTNQVNTGQSPSRGMRIASIAEPTLRNIPPEITQKFLSDYLNSASNVQEFAKRYFEYYYTRYSLPDKIVIEAFMSLNLQYPLHEAVANYIFPVMRFFITNPELVPNINLHDNLGKTPLHHAAISGNVIATIELIKAGANVDAQDRFEKTPLHYAACLGKISVVEMLIRQGANVYAQDKYRRTPLHYARTSGHLETVRELLKICA